MLAECGGRGVRRVQGGVGRGAEVLGRLPPGDRRPRGWEPKSPGKGRLDAPQRVEGGALRSQVRVWPWAGEGLGTPFPGERGGSWLERKRQ